MTEYLQPTIGTTNDVNTIIIIPPQQTIEPKQLKTKSYVLNASKRYRDKNPEKMKEYREKYKKEKADLLINSLPNDNLTKFQLITKIIIFYVFFIFKKKYYYILIQIKKIYNIY